MVRKIKPPILFALSAALAVCSVVARGDDVCSAATLRGVYIFSASGFNIIAGAAQPKAVMEMIRFHGDGTLTVLSATVSQNGVVSRPPAGLGGTYSVEADCTGKLQFGPPGPSFDLLVSSRSEFFMNQTGFITAAGSGPPGVLQGVVKLSAD